MKRHAPATQRNREPLLTVLRTVLPAAGTVLEIASGTGQYACFLAANLPGITWVPTDRDAEGLASIRAWRADGGPPNLEAPRILDVLAPWTIEAVDAVVAINLVHISP